METLVTRKPSSYLKIMTHSLELYRRSLRHVIGLSLLFALIVFIPRLLSLVIGQDLLTDVAPLNPYRLWFLAIDIAGLIVLIALLWDMHCVIINKREPLVKDFRQALNKIGLVFVAALLQILITCAVIFILYGFQILLSDLNLEYSTVLKNLWYVLLIAGIFVGELILVSYIGLLFVFFIPVIAIENKGIIGAFEQSASVVWNHWWRTLWTLATPWIVYVLVIALIRNFLNIELHIYFLERAEHSLTAIILNIALLAVFLPWSAATILIELHDLELRKKLKNNHHEPKK